MPTNDQAAFLSHPLPTDRLTVTIPGSNWGVKPDGNRKPKEATIPRVSARAGR